MKKLTDYLDPTLWLLAIQMLAIVYLLVERQDNKNALNRANLAAIQQYEQLSQASRAKERALRNELDHQATTYRKEKQDEQVKNNATITALRTGTQRVSVAVRACSTTTNGADPTAASGDTKTRAELAPEVAAALASIAADGDDAIHDLNACVNAYNLVRDRLNVQAQ